MRIPTILSMIIIAPLICFAAHQDQGYRYNHARGNCANALGTPGRSEMFFGVCGNLQDTRLTGLDLRGAWMMGADISFTKSPRPDNANDYTKFNLADLRGLKAQNTYWVDASFKKANLERADFTDAIFTIRGSPSQLLDFSQANLTHTLFRYAKLYYVNMNGANLRGTDFRGAVFGTVTAEGAVFDQYTKLPFSVAVAESLGMIYEKSEVAWSAHDKFEPAFLSSATLIFDRPCSDENTCKAIYGEAAQRKSLRTFGEIIWSLTRFDDVGPTLWLDTEMQTLWSDPVNIMYSWKEAKRYCEKLGKFSNKSFQMPTRRQIYEGYERGFVQALPSMIPTGLYWTSESPVPQYNEYFYVLQALSGMTNFYKWHEDRYRVVCIGE